MGVSVTALARSNAAAADPGATAVGITRKPGQAPIVLYIAGSGRSGSTLLERALGEIPGFVNVGELIDLYRRVAEHGERCGCGQEFGACPFWSQVGERAVGGWQEHKLAATRDLQAKVARQRRMPRLLAMPLAGARFRADVAAYGAGYAGLYEGIAAEAGAACVVDASKWPVQALALARAGLDVRVIHLVRDVRGVAYSLGKRDVSRPHAVGAADVMTHQSPAEAAARWVAVQSQAGLLRWCGLPVARMRYEDFVRRPRQAVEAALAGAGLSVPPAHLAHIGDGRVMLGTSHGLSGNPSRFRDGEITLRADETWRASMSRRDRLIVTAIALPLMLRYGITAAGSPAKKQDAHD
jgi:sulfotransferase family protein